MEGLVLVVDDDARMRSIVARRLEHQGFSVAVARDGREAWDLARSEPVAMLVTDVDMPRMDGRELVRRLRARRPDLPILYVTGGATVDGESALCLQKPFAMAELDAAVVALTRA